MRDSVAARVPQEKRRAFWRWVFAETPRRQHAAGSERAAAILLKDAIQAGGAPDDDGKGLLSMIPAPSDADLLTLRAVQRLQEADMIFHPTGADSLLELARRDAERATNELLATAIEHVQEGARVVWLFEGATPDCSGMDGFALEVLPGLNS